MPTVKTCVHCQRERLIHARGMCKRCYWNQENRYAYPKADRPAPESRPCLHCGWECRAGVRRGLCNRCYNNPATRDRYPRDARGRKMRPDLGDDLTTADMTYEELTAFVDAQLADPSSLPAWWQAEADGQINQTPIPAFRLANGEWLAVANPR